MSFVSLFIRPALLARFVPRSGYTVLSSKRGNKNFYKGRGAQPTGHHTKHGGFRLDSWKLPDYVVPDLTNFEVCGGCRAGRVAHGRGVHSGSGTGPSLAGLTRPTRLVPLNRAAQAVRQLAVQEAGAQSVSRRWRAQSHPVLLPLLHTAATTTG